MAIPDMQEFPQQRTRRSAVKKTRPGTAEAAEKQSMKLVLVTPELAKKWLKTNVNRPTKPLHIRYLKKMMELGLFYLLGDAITFDWSGKLRNGQNRLVALIEKGASYYFWVLEGADPDSFKYMDSGVARSSADSLAIMGYPNAAVLSAALKWVVRFERGTFYSNGVVDQGRVLKHEEADAIEKHEDLIDSMHEGIRKNSVLTPSLGLFCHWMFAQKDREAADQFFDRLASGADLPEGHPILVLRNTLLLNSKEKSGKFHAKYKIAITIIAWNKLRLGRTFRSKILKWDADGDIPFPI